MKVLGLDVSSQCTGWALMKDCKLIERGDIDISQYKNTGTINNHMLYCYAVKMKELIVITKPDVVAVESVYIGKNALTGLKLAMMSGIARVAGFAYTKNEVATISPTEVNHFLGVAGRPKRPERKKLVVDRINERYKLTLYYKQDDVADAIGVAAVASHQISTTGRIRSI